MRREEESKCSPASVREPLHALSGVKILDFPATVFVHTRERTQALIHDGVGGRDQHLTREAQFCPLVKYGDESWRGGELITDAKVQRLGPCLIIRAATNTKEMTNWPSLAFSVSRQRWAACTTLENTQKKTFSRRARLHVFPTHPDHPSRTQECPSYSAHHWHKPLFCRFVERIVHNSKIHALLTLHLKWSNTKWEKQQS